MRTQRGLERYELDCEGPDAPSEHSWAHLSVPALLAHWTLKRSAPNPAQRISNLPQSCLQLGKGLSSALESRLPRAPTEPQCGAQEEAQGLFFTFKKSFSILLPEVLG